MRKVIVFSTSIQNENDLELIKMEIDNLPGIVNWSVDLEDWEKILRIEGEDIISESIVNALYKRRIFSRELL